jgi:hypothetical protein
MDTERLKLLLHGHFDDVLEAPERAELNATLMESDAARQEFWQIAKTNAVLREWGKQSWGQPSAVIPSVPRWKRAWPWAAVAGTAAAVALGGFWLTTLPFAGRKPLAASIDKKTEKKCLD